MSQTFTPNAAPLSAIFTASRPRREVRKVAQPLAISDLAVSDLDATDRAIAAAIAEHRARTGEGPTRSELRVVVGLPPPPLWKVIAEQVSEENPDLVGKKLQAKVRRRREREDPLAVRLSRLERGQWITYTTEARSLDIGLAAVVAFRAARSTHGGAR